MSDTPRYEPIVKIASGGMATVHLGTVRGELGFRQLVAIKRPHQHLLDDDAFRWTLLTEARLAASIRHANVVAVRDVETVGDSVQLVMDYVAGASLGDLIVAWSKDGPPIAPAVAVRIVLDACAGLHAAHELIDDGGQSLGLVHRDVSPQNILVGLDGVARVADFGIAKCAEVSGAPTTRGSLKGKVGYMAPEYVRGADLDRRADVFALGVVLWESLVGKRLFRGASEGETLDRVLTMKVPTISQSTTGVGAALDDVVARSLMRDRDARFASAEEFGAALEAAARSGNLVASPSEVGKHVRAVAGDAIEERERAVRERLEAPSRAVEIAADAATRVDVPRRSRSSRPLAIVIAVIAIAGGATAIVLGIRASPSPPATTAAPSIASTAPVIPASPSTTETVSTPSASASSTASIARPRVDPPRATSSPRASTSSRPTWPPPNPYPR